MSTFIHEKYILESEFEPKVGQVIFWYIGAAWRKARIIKILDYSISIRIFDSYADSYAIGTEIRLPGEEIERCYWLITNYPTIKYHQIWQNLNA